MPPNHTMLGRPHRPWWALLPLLLVLVALVRVAVPAPRLVRVHAAGSTVHYPAGWNLIAAPSGSDLGALPGSLYAFGPASDAYQPVAPADTLGGRGYWAYFGTDTDVTLEATAAQYTRLLLPANHYALIGNPSSTQPLPIAGADVAYTYDAALGYVQVAALRPGQAAWVLASRDTDVTVGKPTSAGAADQVRTLQAGLTTDAADLTPFGKLPGVAEQFVNARDYAMVQTAMDDTRAAFGDGLLRERAAAQPTLSAVQHDAELTVRHAVAQAQADMASGNTGDADQQITAARTAAQTAEDDAAAIARSSGPSQWLPAYAAARAYTPQSLARYGNLCNATVLALGMNLPPSDAFVDLVVATLNNQPPPPATGQPTATPSPSPTPTPANQPLTSAVTLASSPNPSPSGQPVSVTATVSCPAGVSSGDTVTVLDGTTALGTVPVQGSGSTGTASATLSGLAAGTHVLSARYSGNAGCAPSTAAALVQTVAAPASAASSVSLTTSPNPSGSGQSVTLTATVSCGAGSATLGTALVAGTTLAPAVTPSGSITFLDGTGPLATVALQRSGGASGTASTSTSGLSVGSHALTAHYSGDASCAAATSAVVTQTVSAAAAKHPTSTSLHNTGNTLIATVSCGTVTPTGSVSFQSETHLLGSAPLDAHGTATVQLPAGFEGTVTAQYAGDGTCAGSTSPPLTIVG